MKDVTLAILAGGAGSRMGMPKGKLHIGDEPILSYLLKRFAWEGPTMLVTAPGREGPPGWEKFDREVVDPIEGQGPLRGMLTALEHATSPLVAVATTDMPGIRGDDLRWLVRTLVAAPDAIGVMTAHDSMIEPFPAIYRISAATVIRARIASNRLSVRDLTNEVGVVTAPVAWERDDPEVWTNLNRPDDLAAFLTRRSSRAGR
jgi:molybdopterin-guanine dinucleotide biosynthesis protein A